MTVVPVVDIHVAQEKARSGDLDGAIELARAVLDDLFDSGGAIWSALATTVLVEALLRRGGDGDLAGSAGRGRPVGGGADRPGLGAARDLAAAAAGAAGACPGDEAATATSRIATESMATELGFEGHMAMAEAMT